jgi:hypothetical protein
MTTPTIAPSFAHRWRAEILAARPPILPARHFIYPQAVEEVEKGALEVQVFPAPPSQDSSTKHLLDAQSFLATCALGFRDPSVPTGVWSCPCPEEICMVAGGYAYVVDTRAPERFSMLEMRPVLTVHAALEAGILLFVGHRTILGWGATGLAWESTPLSDEGLTVTGIEGNLLRGQGWQMLTDREFPFALDLETGQRIE